MFCADDGTQLVSDASGGAEPRRSPSDSQPTLIAPSQLTPPPAANYQPTAKKRKWLAVIALVLGVFALPFLLYSLSQEIIWEYGFRNLRIERLFLGVWGIATVLGTLLVVLSVIIALVAIIVSMRKPAQYGGRLLALVGPVISVFLLVLVVGVFAFRRSQGSTYEIFTSDSNSNSNPNWNDNSNRSSNSNATASNDNASDNSNSSPSTSDASEMSETDKYRLFYAAAKSGDTDLQHRAAKKIGIVDENGMPTSTYQSFIRGTVKWAFDDSAWVRSLDTPEKARAYALERL